MFVHLIEFEVVAEKEPQWEPYMRNFHAVEARMLGGVLFRALRRHTRVYEGASAPRAFSCAVFDAAWGVHSPAAYQEFMETLASAF